VRRRTGLVSFIFGIEQRGAKDNELVNERAATDSRPLSLPFLAGDEMRKEIKIAGYVKPHETLLYRYALDMCVSKRGEEGEDA